jgi:hypothetical protein
MELVHEAFDLVAVEVVLEEVIIFTAIAFSPSFGLKPSILPSRPDGLGTGHSRSSIGDCGCGCDCDSDCAFLLLLGGVSISDDFPSAYSRLR